MLPNKNAKEKIKNKSPLLCAFLRIPDPSIAEIMALNGVELIVIDQEHYQINSETMVNILRAADQFGTSCLVRVTCEDTHKIGKFLDMGASGILLADVESVDDVKKVIDCVKFPPFGKRGVSSESRCGLYGNLYSTVDYAKESNKQTIISVVIETKEAVEHLDELLAIPELDMFSVGSADLSHAYGYPGQTKHPEIIKLRTDIYKQIDASGKTALDKLPSPDAASSLLKEGISCFYITSDTVLLDNGLKNIITPLQKVLGQEVLSDD